jgi:hypothetical protein
MKTESVRTGLAMAVALGLCLSLIVSTNAIGDDETIAPAGDGLIVAPVRPQPDDGSREPVSPYHGQSVQQVTDRISEENRLACNAWCNDHKPECSKCMPSGLCDTGFVVLQTWGNGTIAWDACKHVASVSMPDTGPPSRPKLPERAPVPPIR